MSTGVGNVLAEAGIVLARAGTVKAGIGTVFTVGNVLTGARTTMLSGPLVERLMVYSRECKSNFGGGLSRDGNWA